MGKGRKERGDYGRLRFEEEHVAMGTRALPIVSPVKKGETGKRKRKRGKKGGAEECSLEEEEEEA